VARIYEAKGRPAQNPIIVHVASIEMARRCIAQWPHVANNLARAFWPGPLTLVLPRSNEIPEIVTAGGPTVGVRWPSHPLIQAVIQACGFPLAAPSANPSNEISPTTAEHVRRGLGSKIHLIVDGGPSQVGIESTVLDLTIAPAKLLRPGMIHVESLLAAANDPEFKIVESGLEGGGAETFLRSPGRLKRHYSPKAKLKILKWRDEADLQEEIAKLKIQPAKTRVIAHSNIPSSQRLGGVSVMPHSPEAFARALYAELHRCDQAAAELIVVEAPPSGERWGAIEDRLARAAG
jgi:L-threonylcarbamoyladenylate synthase